MFQGMGLTLDDFGDVMDVRCPQCKARNRSMASRLPRWMKSAKNREVMIGNLARLREMLN